MITPPLVLICMRISSGTLRGSGHRAKALEWLAMIGALRHTECIGHGRRGDMRDIDEHSQPVHLADDALAEGR